MPGKLSPLEVSRQTTPGKYPDGGGLYLQVGREGSKSWLYRHWIDGKERWYGLGSFKDVSLKQAREKRDEARQAVRAGADLVKAKQEARAQVLAAETVSTIPTFRESAERYIAKNEANWKNRRHRLQWSASLKRYAFPILGDIRVNAIRPSDVLNALSPIWSTKRETANRVRGRIETILASEANIDDLNYRNPAELTLQLKNKLPARESRKRKSHPALPYAEVPVFIAKLRTAEGIAARALEFTILNASRTTETIGALWSEFDLGNLVWSIPGGRMKMEEGHTVPLSAPVISLLEGMAKIRQSGFVFPSYGSDALSDAAMLAVLKRIGYGHVTVHGMRATFATWAEECTDYPDGVREAALAHKYKTETVASYQRGTKLEKRRALMKDWAEYCSKELS